MAEDNPLSAPVYSIGHGNRGLADFIAQLKAAAVTCLVDVRAYPSSKRHPQFTRLALEPALRGANIRYVWEGEALGGMRSARAGSLHVALTDPVLRAYADHMSNTEYQRAVSRLLQMSREQVVAIMCAEREPVHCHRSFIADTLLQCGASILHLYDTGDVRRHALRPEARCTAEGKIIYDSGEQLGLTL